MSGRKQHFIPQSLLRGFGLAKRKKTYVHAFTFDRGIFRPPTEGIGAEREFYSALSVDGDENTLDDRITNHEGSLGDFLTRLRALPAGECVDSGATAEFVSHLIFRNDHVRKTIGFTTDAMIADIMRDFGDPASAKAMLGVGAGPSSPIAAAVREVVESHGPMLRATGIVDTEAEMEQALLRFAVENFDEVYAEIAEQLSAELPRLTANLPDMIANVQRDALDARLAPSLKVDRLSALRWHIIETPSPLLLPDCLGVAIDPDGSGYPLPLADLSIGSPIFMPVATHRLLVGARHACPPVPAKLNEIMAGCAWDFFVTRDRSPAFEALRPTVRSRVSEILNLVLECARDVGCKTTGVFAN